MAAKKKMFVHSFLGCVYESRQFVRRGNCCQMSLSLILLNGQMSALQSLVLLWERCIVGPTATMGSTHQDCALSGRFARNTHHTSILGDGLLLKQGCVHVFTHRGCNGLHFLPFVRSKDADKKI